MKKAAVTTFAAALLATSTAFAQPKMDDMKSAPVSQKPSTGAHMTHAATGVVKKVDPKVGLVTLAHDPVKSMNWPAMTMGFQVSDSTLFEKLTVGKKVSFEFVQGTKGYVVTAVK